MNLFSWRFFVAVFLFLNFSNSKSFFAHADSLQEQQKEFRAFQSKKSPKKWTIMVYLNADNNLEGAGYDDVHEMEKVGSSDDIDIVVQFDWLRTKGTKRLHIKKADDTLPPPASNEIRSEVVQQMAEQDMGVTSTLINFAVWTMQNYPAENYAIILWNHGSGWSKESNSGEIFKSISYDDTSGNHIRTNELSNAFSTVQAITGNKFSVIGFDACLMGMIEIMNSLEGYTDYVISSEETIPFDGYPYNDFLSAFTARPTEDKTPIHFAKDLVQKYGESYSGGSQGNSPVTLSAVDLSQLAGVRSAMNTWVREIQNISLDRKEFLKAVNGADHYSDADYRDLTHYVKSILDKLMGGGNNTNNNNSGNYNNNDPWNEPISDEDWKKSGVDVGAVTASLDLIRAIQNSVVENFATSRRYGNSYGMSIYIPYGYGGYSSWGRKADDRHSSYLDLKLSTETHWPSHLDFLFPGED